MVRAPMANVPSWSKRLPSRSRRRRHRLDAPTFDDRALSTSTLAARARAQALPDTEDYEQAPWEDDEVSEAVA